MFLEKNKNTSQVELKILYLYISWFIECKPMLTSDRKYKHLIETETLTYNVSSAIVWTWCLPTLTYVWSFSGLKNQWFFFIPVSFSVEI